jgi:predicted DCC family thiol-disulfide oxidoreductase YuxK
MDREIPSSIVFFDGVCNLCNGFVDFLVRRDRWRTLRFASLQGKTSLELLGPEAGRELASVVLYQDGEVLKESDAALRILELLGGPWRAVALFRIFPRFLRDWLYRLIARNRYRLFGKRETCRLPSPDERALFLD